MTSIVSGKRKKGGQHSAFKTRRDTTRKTNKTTHRKPHAPLSSISSDAGVSSSLILFPSYKNLLVIVSASLNEDDKRVRQEDGKRNAHRMLDTSLPTLPA